MRKRLAAALAVGAVAAFGFAPAGASAAHCAESDSPGFSYYGNDHVQETDHNGDGPGQPEGGNAHNGNPGASNCRETTGSPSERAQGKNR